MRHSHGLRAAAGGELKIGDYYQGGYFAGYISHTADGIATHALIVAPAASGYTTLQWKTTNTSSPDTSSDYDGATNTASMADINHPAANFCANLSIGGYTDWYMPARDELEIAYYNLKPTSYLNSTNFGINNHAVPQRLSNYTSGNPAQTNLILFQEGNSEAFVASNNWSSNNSGTSAAIAVNFIVGAKNAVNKDVALYVRAFRKIAL